MMTNSRPSSSCVSSGTFDRRRIASRRGATLIEIIFAVVILTVCLLSMATFVGRLSKATRLMQARSTASELVADRLEQVKAAVRYTAIDSLYAVLETSVVPGFARRTMVSRVGGGAPDLDDYKVVTVIVTSAQLPNPMKKTTIISAF